MTKQLNSLIKLELVNLYGRNAARYTKDQSVRRRNRLLTGTWIFLILMLVFYLGGFSYGLIILGLQDIVPTYLLTLTMLILFVFGVFKAGGVLFRKNGYDIFSSLPITQVQIVLARFVRMYVENLLMALVLLLPGLAVYGWLLRPGILFYLLGFLGILAAPLLPVALSALFGALVTGIACRMKHKSLVISGLSILFVLASLGLSSSLAGLEGNITPEMLIELSETVLAILERFCPPAAWLGSAMVQENVSVSLLCLLLFLGVFAAVTALVSANFHTICRKLYSTAARHDYQMEKLQTSSVLTSLCKREFKRYFSSSVYVSNTIIGPILGTVFAASLLFAGLDTLEAALGLPLDLQIFVPFLLAGIFCLMNTTSVSISMEGKNWWILKTLPLSGKTILDAKLLMSLLLLLPFFLVSEVLLVIALKPAFWELLWLVLLPALLILFSCVFGLTANLLLPSFNWDSESSVVKQSASSLIGGFGGFLMALLLAIPSALVTDAYRNLLNLGLCLFLAVLTGWLYRQNCRTELKDI